MKISFVKLDNLKQHEQIEQKHLNELLEKIKKDGIWTHPIVIDEKNNIILDGHHRFNVARKLGLDKIPAYFVNYLQNNIKVLARRKNINVSKEKIIATVKAKKLFPPKTTRHVFDFNLKNISVPLAKLK
ncbi:MAG: ParB N-terminal domain-containing protein [Patescibacteria group bacterium]